MLTWKQRVKDLQATGLTKVDIAKLCEAGVTTICDIADGTTTDPRWNFASRLHRLHRERCPDKLDPVQ